MDKEERTIKADKIYTGKILSLKIETVELPNQKYSKREIVEHNPAVAVVAVTENDEILLIEQFRKAVEKKLYEIPAGLIEPGENPKDAAVRELEEETGYLAKECEYQNEFFTSPGFCTENMYMFFAKDLEFKEQNLDTDEFIDLVKVPFEEALRMVKFGEIIDAKTILGILLYDKLRRQK